MNDQTAIVPVQQRALQALGLANIEQSLKALAAESKTLVAITNQAAYSQLHAARVKLKNTRVDIQKKGKAARDDANAFNKAVIAEEKRLLDLIIPEEDRLTQIQSEWDDARLAEQQALADAEAARIARIQTAIDEIRYLPQEAMGKDSAHALSVLAQAQAMVLTEAEYQEHLQTAQSCLFVAITAIKGVVSERQAHEAEQARIQQERAELARLRAADEERQREESIRLARERQKEREELDRQRAEARAAQDAADAAQREADRQTAELERQRRLADEARLAEDMRVAALQEAEAQRLADERAELERRERELEAAKTDPLETVTIPKWEYDLLVSESKLLHRLQDAGVKNWEGYSEP